MHLVDVTVPGARQGDRAEASLASSTTGGVAAEALGNACNTRRNTARNTANP